MRWLRQIALIRGPSVASRVLALFKRGDTVTDHTWLT